MSLGVLCGVLNSSLGAYWFGRHAKKRGVNLEINLNVLRRFPLPPARDRAALGELEALVERRHTVDNGQAAEQLDTTIDRLVLSLYGIEADAYSRAVASEITG